MERRGRTRRAPVAGIADSGLSSLGNFAVGIVGARCLSLHEFGILALALVGGYVCVGLSRALHGDQYVLLHAGQTGRARFAAGQRVVGATTVAATACGAVLAAGGLVAVLVGRGDAAFAGPLIALGASVPLLCLQDLYRSLEYAAGRPERALVNSGLWTASLLACLAVMAVVGNPTTWVFVALWGTTAGVGALTGAATTRLSPRWRTTSAWYRSRDSLAGKLLTDYVLLQATAEGSLFLVAAAAGADAVGLLRMAQIPLAAITVMTAGLISVKQPQFVRSVRGGAAWSSVARSAGQTGAVAALGAVAVGAAVWAVPTSWMAILMGGDWGHARDLVPVLTLYLALGSLAGVLGVALRALGRLGTQVRVRWMLLPIALALVLSGSTWGGAQGAAWALTISSALVTVSWGGLLHRSESLVDAR